MSANRLKLHTDQENQHQVAPAKTELRNPALRDIPSATNGATKRPLSAKSNPNEKRMRVPLGGKNPNQGFPALQRSKSSLPLTFQAQSLKQGPASKGDALMTKPTLVKSNLSLGFFSKPAKIAAPAPRPTNPHKNTLLPLQDLNRPSELVPRFLSDSLTKAAPRALPPLQQKLSQTLSDATACLSASNLPTHEQFVHSDPIKRGAFSPEVEQLIESLAEDENSVETVPEAPKILECVPADEAPFTEAEMPFLYREEQPSKLTDMFAPNTRFFSDDEELCSEAEKEMNTAFHEELTHGIENKALGLTAADLDDLLDF